MSGQRFYASPTDTFTWANGAIGHRPGGSMDCLGPYAKVHNCPIKGTLIRRTCYATGYADTAFSVPAVCTVRGQRISGFFTSDEHGLQFVPMDRCHILLLPEYNAASVEHMVREGVPS